MYSKIFVTLFLVLLPSVVKAQFNNTRFQRYMHEEGLSDNAVQALYQDGHGYIWIGTQGSLYRYNGHTFKSFPIVPEDSTTLSEGFIYTIKGDKKGHLWIGTRGGGVNVYDPVADHFTRYAYNPSSTNTLSNNFVRAILPDENGTIWIGANNGVLHELDPSTGAFKVYFPPDASTDSNAIFDIHKSTQDSNILWIGRSDGLFQFNMLTKKFDDFSHLVNGTSESEGNAVYCMIESTDGTLWVGTSHSGLLAISPSRTEVTSFRQDGRWTNGKRIANPAGLNISDNRVYTMIQDNSGQLWIGTLGGGLNRFDPATGEFEHYLNEEADTQSLSNNTVTDVLIDHSGLLWVGTYVGLNTYSPVTEQIEYYGKGTVTRPGLNDAEVLAVVESKDGAVWIGTKKGGLSKLDREKDTFQSYFEQIEHPLNRINAIQEDTSGRLWLGSDENVLYVFDRSTESVDSIMLDDLSTNSTVQDVYESPHYPGVIWVGTSHSGFYRYDTASGSLEHYFRDIDNIESVEHALNNNYVTKLYQDSQGVFWVTTRGGGVNLFDPEQKSFTPLSHHAGMVSTISSNDVLSMFEDQEGTMWFGTPAGGLNKFDRSTNGFIRYRLGTGDIIGILADDDGHLWLGTTNGILRFNPDSDQLIRLGLTEGLQGLLFRDKAQYRGANGALYFGGINGLNVIQPDAFSIKADPSPVRLTSVLVNDQEVHKSAGDTLDLKHYQNFLDFEFTVLDYGAPDENQYRYFMEGQDKGWVENGKTNTTRYSNLNPGTYRFNVQGASHLGVWSDSSGFSPLVIHINPAFWQTIWFKILVGLVLLGTGYSVNKYRLSKQIAIQNMRMRGMKDMENLRMRIAGQLHDNVSANLSTIGLKAESIAYKENISDQEKARLEEITRLARDSANSIRETSWVVNTGFDRLDKLVAAMEDVGYEMIEDIADLSFTQDENIDDIPITMEFRQNVYYFFRETLHNIIKHAHADRVDVQVLRKGDYFEMVIKDDGKGFDPNSVRESNGIVLYQKRASDIKGEVHIESAIGEGTTIRLRAPIQTVDAE